MTEHEDFNNRVHDRHDYRAQVYFDFIYDFHAKIEFEKYSPDNFSASDQRHSGLTRNISTQGICFTTDVEVTANSIVDIFVYVPDEERPVNLKGEVRWSKIVGVNPEGSKRFDVGVHLLTVNGKGVQETIHFDDSYHVYWSDVLELLLGKFRRFQQ
jgi:hypothetical protein